MNDIYVSVWKSYENIKDTLFAKKTYFIFLIFLVYKWLRSFHKMYVLYKLSFCFINYEISHQ